MILRDPITGRFTSPHATAIERFKSYCEFDALTGCVLWTGGRTKGQGGTTWYGCFKYEGKVWKAHRWAAKFIHGLQVDDAHDIHHCCPHGHNSLCVEHLQSLTPMQHRDQHWLLTEMGAREPAPVEPVNHADLIPWYEPPAWLGRRVMELSDDCPF